MIKERQLATRGSNGHMNLAQYAKAVAQWQAQVTEKAICDAVLSVLDQPVSVIKSDRILRNKTSRLRKSVGP
jgi:hypothetical protein